MMMNNQSPPSTTTNAPIINGGVKIPEHIADPFDLHESLTVAITTAALVTYIHFTLQDRLYGGDNKTTAPSTTKELNVVGNNNKSSSSSSSSLKTLDPEFGARIVSFLHAVISTVGSGYALWYHMTDGSSWFDTRPATRLEANWQMFSLSYFACDTLFMLFGKFDLTFFIHHLIAMASLVCGSLFGIYGPIVASAQFCGEISNGPMHLRWLLNASEKRDTLLCKVSTQLWFVTFFVARLVVCPYLGYYAVLVMHPVFWPQVWLMIIFSGKFLFDAVQKERKGEWWIG